MSELNVESIELPQWDPMRAWNAEKGVYTMAIIGSSKSGKSTFLSWLYRNVLAKQYDIKIMASINCHAPIYQSFREFDGHLMPEWNPRLIKMLHHANKYTKNYFSVLNMIDDQVDIKEDRTIKDCFLIYRNANINTIYSTQAWSFINKAVRGNLQYVVLMKINSLEEMTDVCDKFLLSFMFKGLKDPVTRRPLTKQQRLEKCIQWYRDVTRDYNMVIIENINDFTMYRFKTPL